MGRRGTITAVISGIVAVIFVVTGSVLIPVLNNVTVQRVDDTIPIKEGSATYNAWVSPADAAPIHFQAFVFNLVNHEEVINEGKKPILEQKGPYTYQEKREKVNITFHENGTVSYRELHYYFFDREMSVGDETDTFTTVNLPMITIAHLLRFEYELILKAVQALFDTVDEVLFLELSVGDILWGYEDNLLKEAKEILAEYNLTLSIDDKFGLFYKKNLHSGDITSHFLHKLANIVNLHQNGSDDGLYSIYTGEKDLSQFAYIDTWNGMDQLEFWTTWAANQINGTAGTMYPPFVKKEDILYLFSSDIGRSLYATFTEEKTLYDIDLLRFVPPKAVFQNHTVNPANTGFCVPAGTCMGTGVLNVSVVRQGAPVVMSQPHFLGAENRYIHGVEGMHPIQEQHETFIDVEPTTGVVMNVAKKLQINAYLERVPYIKDLEKITNKSIVYPVLWVNESATITKQTADEFKSQVQDPIRLTHALEYSLIVIGVAVLLLVMLYAGKAVLSSAQPSSKAINHVADDTSSLVTA